MERSSAAAPSTRCSGSIPRRRSRPPTPTFDDALRLAAFQLLFLDRVPAYAVVDDAVTLATRTSRRAGGFVNAVLRRVAADGRARLAELAEVTPPETGRQRFVPAVAGEAVA